MLHLQCKCRIVIPTIKRRRYCFFYKVRVVYLQCKSLIGVPTRQIYIFVDKGSVWFNIEENVHYSALVSLVAIQYVKLCIKGPKLRPKTWRSYRYKCFNRSPIVKLILLLSFMNCLHCFGISRKQQLNIWAGHNWRTF